MSKRQIRKSNPSQVQNKNQNSDKMKRLYKEQIVNLVQQDQSIEEIYPLKRNKSNNQIPKNQYKMQDFQENIMSHNQQKCLVCLQQNFGFGKCILDCSHTLCNECYMYWQQVSQICPICNKKSTSVLSILDGQSRMKKIDFNDSIPLCSKCNKNNHYHLMYFCDKCNESCIHTYCQPSLIKQKSSQKWICQNCIYSTYYQNKYNQESVSQNSQQIYNDEEDSFIVSDNVVQYIEDYNDDHLYLDSQVTIKQQNHKPKKNKSKGQRNNKKKK